jgi:hypothetical protein
MPTIIIQCPACRTINIRGSVDCIGCGTRMPGSDAVQSNTAQRSGERRGYLVSTLLLAFLLLFCYLASTQQALTTGATPGVAPASTCQAIRGSVPPAHLQPRLHHVRYCVLSDTEAKPRITFAQVQGGTPVIYEGPGLWTATFAALPGAVLSVSAINNEYAEVSVEIQVDNKTVSRWKVSQPEEIAAATYRIPIGNDKKSEHP